MKVRLMVALAVLVVFTAGGFVLAQGTGLKLVQVLPAQLAFRKMPNGSLQAPVVGDPAKRGPYALRVRIPAGARLLPHSHPDDRIVVVLGGSLYLGYGERFDETAMKLMPPGSVFTEPAGKAHYTWAKDAGVVLHVTGNGPTGTTEIPER